jgi:DNA replication protein DnaC
MLAAYGLFVNGRMEAWVGGRTILSNSRGPLGSHKAVREGFTSLYVRAPRLFRDLAVARADGSFGRLLDRIARIDVLLVDDWAMAPLADTERRDFLEICDDRYSTRSTILTSQVPVTQWHDQIGDPTVADSILDRLVHNAHRIELQGASMRKTKNAKDSHEQASTE